MNLVTLILVKDAKSILVNLVKKILVNLVKWILVKHAKSILVNPVKRAEKTTKNAFVGLIVERDVKTGTSRL